jgi:hypothetical protein
LRVQRDTDRYFDIYYTIGVVYFRMCFGGPRRNCAFHKPKSCKEVNKVEAGPLLTLLRNCCFKLAT